MLQKAKKKLHVHEEPHCTITHACGKNRKRSECQRTVNGIVTCPLPGRLGNLKNDLDENRCNKKVRREKRIAHVQNSREKETKSETEK